MSKYKVAILAGGYSSEWEISMLSAQVVLQNLDSALYEGYIVEIRKEGWQVNVGGHKIDLNLNQFGFESKNGLIKFDVAFNAIHGIPGENGELQGYMEARGIRHTSCSQAVSALTFSKWECNVILKQLGFTCAKSVFIQHGDAIDEESLIRELGLPFFLKPNNSGSSFGVSKVKRKEDIQNAVKLAMKEDREMVAEAFMDGMELGCGVFRSNGKIIALPPTEIVSQNEFFDYEAKYQGKSEEITPARLDQTMIQKIQTISSEVYRRMKASGVIRVDFMLVKDVPHIIEINTIPGLSAESIVPKQAKCAGYSLQEFFGILIKEALS